MADPNATHKAAQVAVVAGVEQAVSRAFKLLDVHSLKATLPRLQAAMYALVTQQGRASSHLALTHYRAERKAAGITSPIELRPAPTVARAQVDATISSATSDLWGAVDDKSVALAEQNVTASVERLILNVGRDSMVGFTNQDRKARAWAREARPDACYFCSAMATRGAVYKSAGTAGENANSRFKGDGLAKFHDNCHCTISPVFGAFEASAHVRQWQADWQRLKDEHGGVSMLLWRQFMEGRIPTK